MLSVGGALDNTHLGDMAEHAPWSGTDVEHALQHVSISARSISLFVLMVTHWMVVYITLHFNTASRKAYLVSQVLHHYHCHSQPEE